MIAIALSVKVEVPVVSECPCVELVEAGVHHLHANHDVTLPEHGPVKVDCERTVGRTH